jgi:hypothetical protein
MSHIVNDLTSFGSQTVIELPPSHSSKTSKPYWRSDGFLSSLDHYMGIVARASALIG